MGFLIFIAFSIQFSGSENPSMHPVREGGSAQGAGDGRRVEEAEARLDEGLCLDPDGSARGERDCRTRMVKVCTRTVVRPPARTGLDDSL